MVPMEYLPLGYSRNYIVGCILSQMPYIVVTVNLQTCCRVQVSFHVAVFKRKSEKKKKSHLRERLTYDLQITRVSGRGSERESVCVCVCACVREVHACMLSHVQLFATLWAIARQASLSTEFPRQEYWSALPFPFPGDLPYPGI